MCRPTHEIAGLGNPLLNARAILVSSCAGDGGIMRDDNNEGMGLFVYVPDHKQPIPSAVGPAATCPFFGFLLFVC